MLTPNNNKVFTKIKNMWFRMKFGFCSDDISGLNKTLARFIEPRLKVFIQTSNVVPSGMTVKEWGNILNAMLDAFHLINNVPFEDILRNREMKQRVELGLSYFSNYYNSLSF